MQKSKYLVLLISLLTAPAVADSGIYAGIALGQNRSDIEPDNAVAARDAFLANSGTTPTATDERQLSGTGFKVIVGYQFSDYFSIEAAGVDTGDVTVQASAQLNDTDRLVARETVLIDGLSASVVVAVPFTQRASFLLKGGAYRWDAETILDRRTVEQNPDGSTTSTQEQLVNDKETGTDSVYGAGFQWRATPGSRVRIEWERYEARDLDVDLVSLSILWMF